MSDPEKQKNKILEYVKNLSQVNQTNALHNLLNTSFCPSISHLTKSITFLFIKYRYNKASVTNEYKYSF